MFWPFIKSDMLTPQSREPREQGEGLEQEGQVDPEDGVCCYELRHPRETEKSSSVEEEDTLQSIEGAGYNRDGNFRQLDVTFSTKCHVYRKNGNFERFL